MYRSFIKRLLDILICLIVLTCIGWFIFLVWGVLTIANKGAGAIFLQERPGKNEKIFKIIKFKTMTDECDMNGKLLPDKDRITPLGKIIRRLSIDELPQLINVLKGDMSFIGPRPLLPEYIPWYTERERIRHSVRPGISGWAQVNGRNNLSWDEKLAMDVYYVENLSFFLDLKVIIKTVVNVIKQKDVNVIPGLRLGRLDVVRKEETKNDGHPYGY